MAHERRFRSLRPADGADVARVLVVHSRCRGARMAPAVNTVWTKRRAKIAGCLIESDLCEMCGRAEDTLHHRNQVCTDPPSGCSRVQIATGPSDLLPPPNSKRQGC